MNEERCGTKYTISLEEQCKAGIQCSLLHLALSPLEQWTVVVDVLDVDAIIHQGALSLQLLVLITVVLGEAPLAGSHDLLATWELELGAAQGLDHVGLVAVLGADGDQDLADVHTSASAVRLSVRVTHTRLQAVHKLRPVR